MKGLLEITTNLHNKVETIGIEQQQSINNPKEENEITKENKKIYMVGGTHKNRATYGDDDLACGVETRESGWGRRRHGE